MRHDDEKPKKPGSMPKWLRYLLAFFMAYMMFVAYRGEQMEGEEGKSQPKIEKYDEISNLVNIDRWQQIVNPNRGKDIEIVDVIEGEFDFAACGQTVRVAIEALEEEGLVAAQDVVPEEPLEFTIGQGVLPWDRVVRGMKQGGKRKLQVGPRYFNEDALIDDLPLRFMLQLQALSPNVKEGVGFSNTKMAKGKDLPISCGETGAFAFAVWKADNTELYQTDAEDLIIHTLGSGELGHGIDRGLVGMQVGEIRKLMIPPAYQKAGITVIFPQNEIAIVEVLRLPYNEAEEEAVVPEEISPAEVNEEETTP